MSIFNGLGVFAGGVAQGVGLRHKIDQIKHEREKREEQKRIDKEIAGAGNQALDSFGLDENTQPPQPEGSPKLNPQQFGLGAVDVIGEPMVETQTDNAIGMANGGVMKYADGGLVQDPKSTVSMVNSASGLSQAQPQPKKPNEGQKLSKMFNAMRDKAFELGRPDLAKDYQMAGFQIRDRMYKENITNAQRAYEMTGDISGFVSAYNDAVDDGAKVEGFEKTETGYKLNINNGGNMFEREFTPDQIRDMVMNFSDPSARYAAEMQALAAKNKLKMETDEKIREQNAIEDNKTHSYGLDNVVVKGGKVIYDGSGNRQQIKDSNSANAILATRDPSDPLYKQAQKFLELDVGQRERVARATKSDGGAKEPKDWNKEMLPVIKEVNDTILGFDGMGETNIETGKVTPTKKGNQAMVFGQRLLKQNPDLPPADVARISHMAATDPNAIDYQVVERADGTRYKRQVIKHNGQIYRLANTGTQEIKEPAKQKDQKQPTKQQAQQPKEAGLEAVAPRRELINKPQQTTMTKEEADKARQSLGVQSKKNWYE